MTTKSETKYECTTRNAPTSINQQTYTSILSRFQIIDLARERLGNVGSSLETFAGIELIPDDDGLPEEDRYYDYERPLFGDEEFEIALNYHRQDGARFDIKEITAI